MTKRRRKKIDKILHDATILEKVSFAYYYKQCKIFKKHEFYLCRMNRRSYRRSAKQLLKICKEAEDA